MQWSDWSSDVCSSDLVTLPSFRRSVLCTVTKRESSMDTMRRTLNHITSYFICCMRCSVVYSDNVATPPVITANAVWKEFKTFLKARLKHVTTKDKWWTDKVRAGYTSQPHANQAMTKMRAEAAEAKVVLIEWTSNSLRPWRQGQCRPAISGLECSPCALGIQGLRCQSLVEGHAGPANRALGLVAGPRLTRRSLFAPKPKRKGLLFDSISERRTVVSCLQEGAIPGC